MLNPFIAAWKLDSKVIRPSIEYGCRILWGIICPMIDDGQVVSINGDLGLEDGAKGVLLDALANKQKNLFVIMLYGYKEQFNLDPVKGGRAITICFEAMKTSTPETTKSVCLNVLGAAILK